MPSKKVLLAVGVAGLLVVAYRFGVFAPFRDPAHLRATLRGFGSVGFLVFVLACALLQPVGLPGVMFWVAASLTWRPPVAIALSLVGSTLASVSGFSFARFVARDWVETKIPARLRKYDERLATHGFVTVFVLRLVLWTNQGLHALFGLSRVRFSTHVFASFLAYLAPIAMVTYLGDAAFGVLRNLPRDRWIELAGLLALGTVAGIAIRNRCKRVDAARFAA